MKYFLLILFTFLLCCFKVIGQNPVYPTAPQIPIGQSYESGNPFPDQWNYFPQLTNPLQTMRDEQSQRIQQQNEQQMQKAGITTAPTTQQINSGTYYDDLAKARREEEQEIYLLINAASFPNNKNVVRILTPHQKSMLKFMQLADTTMPDYKKYNQIYVDAANELVNMLSGKTPLDLKKAVFITENAYYHDTLRYYKYLTKINRLVLLCKAIEKLDKSSINNKLSCNYAIQALYQDTLLVGKKIIYPFVYDFDDFFGDNDYSKLFVTKLLNTGTGQCHSMPLLYLILAQELHTDAYLAYAPMHSYIKFPIDSTLYDFETTCGKPNTDEWLVKSGFISAASIRNGVYLNPLSLKQTIAQCLVDLASEYIYQIGQCPFTEFCCHLAANYYPPSLSAYQCLANYRIALCKNLAEKYHYPPLSAYANYPDLKKSFDDMVQYKMQIDATGFVTLTGDEYIQMIDAANVEKEKIKEKQIKKIIYLRIQNGQQ